MKSKIVKQMFKVATFAMMFGAASVQAQQADKAEKSGTSAAASSGKSAANGAGSVSKQDQKTMQEMAHANLAEIEAGKLALTKTQNDKVKTFAQKMVDDHTKAHEDLKKVAEAKGVALPTQPDSKHQKMAKKLSGLSGEEFDREYMAQGGVADHKKVHRMLERAESRTKDAELKELVSKTEPVVGEHLTMAQQIHSEKGGEKTAASPKDRAKMAPNASGSSSGGASTGGTAK